MPANLSALHSWYMRNGYATHVSTPVQPTEPLIPARTPIPSRTAAARERAKSSALNNVEPAKYSEIPAGIPFPGTSVELGAPKPLSAFNDDPVFWTADAAQILGLNADTMKKWRNRRQGPDYIQYGQNGPVRYALSTLMAFRKQHTVEIQNKSRAGGRRRGRPD